MSRTRDQKWFQLRNGAWIASWLVDYAPLRLPTSRDLPEAPSEDGSVPVPAWTPFPFTADDPSVIRMGQVTEGKGWRFKVSEAQKRKEICLNDTCVEARGYYLVVLIDVENMQGAADSFYRNIGPFLIDDPGREYVDNTDASFLFMRENPEFIDLFASVAPGGTARVVMVFDLPENTGKCDAQHRNSTVGRPRQLCQDGCAGRKLSQQIAALAVKV